MTPLHSFFLLTARLPKKIMVSSPARNTSTKQGSRTWEENQPRKKTKGRRTKQGSRGEENQVRKEASRAKENKARKQAEGRENQDSAM